MTSEMLSIIAVCISGATAVCSATIPAILSFITKKAELASQKQREDTQAYNTKFEAFYNKHLQICSTSLICMKLGN
jgi:Na+-translocating ferredoxin:NAD+ oxidoreductase RnfC subunit